MKTLFLLAALISFMKAEITIEKIASINSYVNKRIVYKSDIQNYKQNDYWATAAETLKKGSGDCEDYAILKYSMLVKAGMKPEDIHFIYTEYQGIGHVYLKVHFQSKVYYLDNIYQSIFFKRHRNMLDILVYNHDFKLKDKLKIALGA